MAKTNIIDKRLKAARRLVSKLGRELEVEEAGAENLRSVWVDAYLKASFLETELMSADGKVERKMAERKTARKTVLELIKKQSEQEKQN